MSAVRSVFRLVWVLLVVILACAEASAARRAKAKEPEEPFAAAICVEAETGLVLFEQNADAVRAPASMVKMMQMLLVAEGLREGKWKLDTPVKVSRYAESMGGSQVYVKEGEEWELGHLMHAVAVASANDAAMVVAEGLWGSEDAYKERMNERAKELGMSHSEFNSVHGLPPGEGEQPDKTTARDMSILARQCTREPQVMEWVGEKEFQFRSGEAVKFNTNKLLWNMPGCDGLKTGFTNEAGFCLSASAERDGVRLVAVLMGCGNKSERFKASQDVLEQGFANIEKVRVLCKGDRIEPKVPVRNCETPEVALAVTDDVWVLLKKGDKERVEFVADAPESVTAPADAGTVLGKIHVRLSGTTIGQADLVLEEDLKPARLRWKLIRAVLGRRGTG